MIDFSASELESIFLSLFSTPIKFSEEDVDIKIFNKVIREKEERERLNERNFFHV